MKMQISQFTVMKASGTNPVGSSFAETEKILAEAE